MMDPETSIMESCPAIFSTRLRLGSSDRVSTIESIPRESQILYKECTLFSLDESSLAKMYDEVEERLHKAKNELHLKQSELNMAFESFEKLSLMQKYVRRNSKTRKNISSEIYSRSLSVSQLSERIRTLESEKRILDVYKKASSLNNQLKERHHRWSRLRDAGDPIEAAGRLKLCELSLYIHWIALGRFLKTRNCEPFQNKAELYHAVSDVKSRLIEAAQRNDECRIAVLTDTIKTQELIRINNLTNSTYAFEILLSVGLDNWFVTPEDEMLAISIYEKETRRRGRLAKQNEIVFNASGSPVLDVHEMTGEFISSDKRQAPATQQEMSLSCLFALGLEVLMDQISVIEWDIKLLRKELMRSFEYFDNMSLVQKFVRSGSVTKGKICSDIFKKSINLLRLKGDLDYYKGELRRLKEIKYNCGCVLKEKTMHELNNFPSMFDRSDFDLILTCLELKSEAESSILNFDNVGCTAAEMESLIIKYDEANNAVVELRQQQPKRRAHSTFSDDFAPLFLHEGDDDEGVNVDSHVGSSENPNAKTVSIAPEVDCPDTSSVIEGEILRAEAALKEARAELEKIPRAPLMKLRYDSLRELFRRHRAVRNSLLEECAVKYTIGKYKNSTEVWDPANDANHKLIELARMLDVFSINMLDGNSRVDSLTEILRSSDLDYIQRVLEIAGVSGWNTTDFEQRSALEACSDACSRMTLALQE